MHGKTTESEHAGVDIADIKAFYDSVYHVKAKAGQISNRGHYLRLLRRLGIGPGTRILDVACGTGGWLRLCNENGAVVSGVDLSDTAIDLCRSVMPQGSFHAQPAESLPFATGEFDIVSCLGSLEHFIHPEQSLKEMARVAKPGATIVILVPNKDFLTRKLGLFSGTYQTGAREVVRTLEEWDSLFRSAGLVVTERWKDLHTFNRYWITSGRFYMWPLRLLQCLLLAIWPLRWQYQVYHRCNAPAHLANPNSSSDAR
jgi:ubiquinone/menaquinone biosynthesis C-methylase UbiE